jgi:hypothetical protein
MTTASKTVIIVFIIINYSGKLPISVDNDAQQVFTTTALELPQQEEEKSRTTTFNSSQDSAPPLPPKPLAG